MAARLSKRSRLADDDDDSDEDAFVFKYNEDGLCRPLHITLALDIFLLVRNLTSRVHPSRCDVSAVNASACRCCHYMPCHPAPVLDVDKVS